MYQPFLRDIGKTLGAGMQAQGLQQQKQQEQQLIQAAYMGQPGAMEQLVSVNPQVASQIQRDKTSQEQQKLQTQRYEEQQTKASEQEKLKAEQALSKKIPELQEVVATVGDFDQAKKYYDQQISLNDTLIKTAGVPPERLEFTPEKYEEIKKIYAQKGKGDDQVQSSKILDSGLVIKVWKNSGDVEVYNPNQDTKEKIKAAELWGAELQGIRAGEREEAKTAAGISKEAYKGIGAAKSFMSNYDEVIKLVDEGASTGVLEKRLPTFREQSIKLQNVRNQLGLDIIGATTFGALSESELEFALDTGLPPLKPEALKKWAMEKKAAQQKVIDNLTEAALFLGVPGNTVADFVKMKQEQEKPKETETKSPEGKTAGAKESAQPANAANNQVTIGGQTFSRPAAFTDQQWSDYKKAVGAQ